MLVARSWILTVGRKMTTGEVSYEVSFSAFTQAF